MQLLNIRKYGFLLVILLSIGVIITSCGDDDPEPGTCNTTDLTYDNFAKDFLINNCSTTDGCHVAGNAADLTIGSFETYSEAKIIADRGDIKDAINHTNPDVSDMPRGAEKLSDCDIDRLSAWVDAGAPEG